MLNKKNKGKRLTQLGQALAVCRHERKHDLSSWVDIAQPLAVRIEPVHEQLPGL